MAIALSLLLNLGTHDEVYGSVGLSIARISPSTQFKTQNAPIIFLPSAFRLFPYRAIAQRYMLAVLEEFSARITVLSIHTAVSVDIKQ